VPNKLLSRARRASTDFPSFGVIQHKFISPLEKLAIL